MFSFIHTDTNRFYWLKVFGLYALAEACIQISFFYTLNNFGKYPVSLIEIHLIMWFFQCLLIWPIWWVAWMVRGKQIIIQIVVNVVFYIVYSYLWFGPVQDIIGYLYNNLLQLTRTENNRLVAILDNGDKYSYLNYQLLKHAFRLSWFYMAAYFYNYLQEEQTRTELAIANKELQLKMLKWHLNPSFYFKTINYLKQVADTKPQNATGPILQLAKVMEYVIYEAKEKLIEVKKEIQFLNNYALLINQQNSYVKIETKVSGEYEHLKISPLLLAGFIEKIADGNPVNKETAYHLQLDFSGNEMKLTISSSEELALITKDEALLHRLKELYAGRFSINNSTTDNFFKLIVKLDETRV